MFNKDDGINKCLIKRRLEVLLNMSVIITWRDKQTVMKLPRSTINSLQTYSISFINITVDS